MTSLVEKQLEIGERTYTLAFSFGSIRRAEKEIGRPIPALMAEGGIGFEFVGIIFWSVLQRDHKVSLEKAESLVDGAGFGAVLNLLMQGLIEYLGHGVELPDADDDAEAGDEAAENPPKKRKADKGST